MERNKYATNCTFGGRRVSVGRDVVLCVDDRSEEHGGRAIVAGKVDRIDPLTDSPIIATRDHGTYIDTGGLMVRDGCQHEPCVFADTSTEAEINWLAVGMWTWPVMVR